jgi:hypothetical protein
MNQTNSVNFSHGIIAHGDRAFYNGKGTLTLRNVLIYNQVTAIANGTTSNANVGENVTFHKIINLCYSTTPALTNCLILAVTNEVSYNGASVYTNQNDAGVFSTFGNGGHYLPADSPHRGVGVAVTPSLATALKQKTSWPPTILKTNGFFSTNLTLSLQAPRGTNASLDRGYYYDPLDWIVGNAILTNGTLTLPAGMVLGVINPGGSPGLTLSTGAVFIAEGSPTNLCRVTRWNTVQEKAASNWSATFGPSIAAPNDQSSPAPIARLRFTDFCLMANEAHHFDGAIPSSTYPTYVKLQDCQFHGGSFSSDGVSLGVTNCLFERVAVDLNDYYASSATSHFRNNLFLSGTFAPAIYHTGTLSVKDNVFDNTIISQSGSGAISHDYNGYVTNASRFNTNGSHDVVLNTTNVPYQTGPLSRYYLPADCAFTNRGSQTADISGLWHHTCTTNEVKETNSVVDLGWHLVAVDSNGSPFDTDGDGVPDAIEDYNGNGEHDLIVNPPTFVNYYETSWRYFDRDYDGRNDVEEQADGTSSTNPGDVLKLRLGYWRFNTSDLKGESNQVPTATNGVTRPELEWHGGAHFRRLPVSGLS